MQGSKGKRRRKPDTGKLELNSKRKETKKEPRRKKRKSALATPQESLPTRVSTVSDLSSTTLTPPKLQPGRRRRPPEHDGSPPPALPSVRNASEAEYGKPDASWRRPAQRDRNRVAAAKCRAKKKSAETELEEAEWHLSQQRDSLLAEMAALKNEVMMLRTQLLQHAECDSDLIQKYLANAAQSIAECGSQGPTGWPGGYNGVQTAGGVVVS